MSRRFRRVHACELTAAGGVTCQKSPTCEKKQYKSFSLGAICSYRLNRVSMSLRFAHCASSTRRAAHNQPRANSRIGVRAASATFTTPSELHSDAPTMLGDRRRLWLFARAAPRTVRFSTRHVCAAPRPVCPCTRSHCGLRGRRSLAQLLRPSLSESAPHASDLA